MSSASSSRQVVAGMSARSMSTTLCHQRRIARIGDQPASRCASPIHRSHIARQRPEAITPPSEVRRLQLKAAVRFLRSHGWKPDWLSRTGMYGGVWLGLIG
jgi:hypothetical protein